jgi:hypothetical protein
MATIEVLRRGCANSSSRACSIASPLASRMTSRCASTTLTQPEDLYELVEGRYRRGSLILTSNRDPRTCTSCSQRRCWRRDYSIGC